MTGYIYAIGNDEFVKIGFTENPAGRAAKIKCEVPFAVDLLGYVEGTRKQESDVHKMLAPERSRGEWYFRGKPTEHFVSKLCAGFIDRRTVNAPRFPAKGLIENAIVLLGNETKLALAAGVSQPVVNDAKRTGHVGPKLAMGIDRATNGRISKGALRPDLWGNPSHAHAHEAAQ